MGVGGAREGAGRPQLPPEERTAIRRATVPAVVADAAATWGRANGIRARSPALIALAVRGLSIGTDDGGRRRRRTWADAGVGSSSDDAPTPPATRGPEPPEMPAADGRRTVAVSLSIAPANAEPIEAWAAAHARTFSAALSALAVVALRADGVAI